MASSFWSRVSGGTLAVWSSGTTTIAIPSGSVGDLLYCVAMSEAVAGPGASNPTTSTPGWTTIQDTTGTGGMRWSFFAKRRAAGEPDLEVTLPQPTTGLASLYSLKARSLDAALSAIEFARGAEGVSDEFDFSIDPTSAGPFDPAYGYVFTIGFIQPTFIGHDDPPSAQLTSRSFSSMKGAGDFGVLGAEVPPNPRYFIQSGYPTNFLSNWAVMRFPVRGRRFWVGSTGFSR